MVMYERLLHHEELQVLDCSCRWTKGCHRSGCDRGATIKWVKWASYMYL